MNKTRLQKRRKTLQSDTSTVLSSSPALSTASSMHIEEIPSDISNSNITPLYKSTPLVSNEISLYI